MAAFAMSLGGSECLETACRDRAAARTCLQSLQQSAVGQEAHVPGSRRWLEIVKGGRPLLRASALGSCCAASADGGASGGAAMLRYQLAVSNSSGAAPSVTSAVPVSRTPCAAAAHEPCRQHGRLQSALILPHIRHVASGGLPAVVETGLTIKRFSAAFLIMRAVQIANHSDGCTERTLSHTHAWYARHAENSHRKSAAEGAPLPLPPDTSAADRRGRRLKLALRSARTPSVATTAIQSDTPPSPCREQDEPGGSGMQTVRGCIQTKVVTELGPWEKRSTCVVCALPL